MFKKLTLENFKNFKEAELNLGPFTILVGANATGKSNIREAFRFLHGIGRGYPVADIIGEKSAGRELVWSGMRGGTHELSYISETIPVPTFSLQLLNLNETRNDLLWARYKIEIATGFPDSTPKVISEKLEDNGKKIFEAWIDGMGDVFIAEAENLDSGELHSLGARWDNTRPVLHQAGSQLLKAKYQGYMVDIVENAENAIESMMHQLASMYFLELDPNTMRKSSFPGQTTLGDNGENLSSVLYAIYQDQQKRNSFLDWLRELTPMDVSDFEFPADQVGKILVTLVEKDGRKISAYSASDGTLRLLGLLAALLGPEPAKFYFFEEIENGIHPSRLHLLLELIEQVTAEGNIQVVATTHSPQLLGLVSDQTLEHTSMTYRLEGHADAHIQRIIDIPDAKEIFQEEDLSRLYEKGWLENSVHFMQNMKEHA
ncbi:MAG: ATP-binding protein [Chloroflexi bacterium]|nr:ATP-binding protein [Chloroflexota bacterium]